MIEDEGSRTLQAFPSCYAWTTYGITIMLDEIWEAQMARLRQGLEVSQHAVEMCSGLERALSFAHTGNPRVLCKLVMWKSGLSRAILEYGSPTLIYSVCHLSPKLKQESVYFDFAMWPRDVNYMPEIASKTQQLLRYGSRHYYVSLSISLQSTFSAHQYSLKRGMIVFF